MKRIIACMLVVVLVGLSASAVLAEGISLKLFHQKQEAQETFAKIIEEFNALYPDIAIEQEIVTNEPAAVLKARIATGEIPDIFQGGLDTIDISKGGYLLDLTDEAFLQNVSEGAVSSPSFTDENGRTWALPIDGSCIGILYNKDIFAQCGLSVPVTVSEFDHVVATLKENGVLPMALGFKDAWTIKIASVCAFSPAVYGRNIMWDSLKNEGETSFADTPAWSEAFGLLRKIYESGDTQLAFGTDYSGACAMIANAEAAMMPQGLWAVEMIRSINPDANIGMMAMPVSEDPSETKLHQFPDFGLSISASSANIEACELFLDFMTQRDVAELWCNSAKLFSAVKGVNVDFDPVASDVVAYIDQGLVCPQADRGWPTAFHADFEAVLGAYLLDNITVEQAMEQLDDAWDVAYSVSK